MKNLIIILLLTLTGSLLSACLGHKPGELYFAAYSKDAQGKYTIPTLYRTRDYGKTAQALEKNFDNAIYADAQPGCFYRITMGETLYFSNDTCRTWTYRAADCAGIMTGTVPGQIFKPFKYSSDFATTWQIPAWNGIPNALYVPLSYCVGHLPGEIYVLTLLDQKIYRSIDYGNNFVLQSVVNIGLEARAIGQGWQAGEILVSNDGVFYHSTDYGLTLSHYKTVNPEDYFGVIKGRLRDEFYNITVERYPTNQYTSQVITFYRTVDFYDSVSQIVCNYNENSIEENGEWRMENGGMVNYPNPFNNSTVISYTLTTENSIALIVYNAKGELVKSLYEGFQSSGSHNITLNADGLNSGVYYIKLSGKNISQTNKCILVK